MGRRNSNRNVDVVIKTAKAMGATVLFVRNGKKHQSVHMRTAEGIEVTMNVSAGHIEPYKQKGWTRQSINRAAGRKKHFEQGRS